VVVISEILRDVLACPLDKAPVRIDEDKALVVCSECGRGYPIREGIPVMLVDEAIPAS
jgi:uncharacterized protein